MVKVTDEMKLQGEFKGGKLFQTVGNPGILVPVLSGSYFDMGVQYGHLLADQMEATYNTLVQSLFDKGLLDYHDAVSRFAKRSWETISCRQKDLIRGIVEGSGFSLEKALLLDQQIYLQIFQAGLHSFSGCSSIFAWGDSTADGRMVLARNLDWSADFMNNPQVFAVFNPSGSHFGHATLAPAGWVGCITGINSQGVFLGLHDGTSMGGATILVDRSPLLNSLTDALADVDSAEGLGRRVMSLRSDVSNITLICDPLKAMCFENPVYATVLLPHNETILVATNTFFNPAFGIQVRDTLSKSIERKNNLWDRLKEFKGKIDINTIMEIMEIGLYNDDGSPGRGATKPNLPKQYDVDVTVHTIAVRPEDLQVWIRVPTQTDWCHIDLKGLFSPEKQKKTICSFGS